MIVFHLRIVWELHDVYRICSVFLYRADLLSAITMIFLVYGKLLAFEVYARMQLALTELVKQVLGGVLPIARIAFIYLIVARLIVRVLEARHEVIYATADLVFISVRLFLLALFIAAHHTFKLFIRAFLLLLENVREIGRTLGVIELIIVVFVYIGL